MINLSMKHFLVKCFWCEKEYHQRCDTIKRQMAKYGHSCCKRCFGKEKSFSEAQKARTDNRSHAHSDETKLLLSALKKGKPSWNKGLNVSDERVKKNAEATKKAKLKNPSIGNKNPNWKGGISAIPKAFPPELKKWMAFRAELIKREYGQCYKCNERFFSNQLDIHHLASRKKYPELEYDELNCVTLCKGCHKQFHKIYGVKNFTPLQWQSWINEDRLKEDYFKFTC